MLVRGGRAQDCPGVKYTLVRGAMDLVRSGPELYPKQDTNLTCREVCQTGSHPDPNTEPKSQRVLDAEVSCHTLSSIIVI